MTKLLFVAIAMTGITAAAQQAPANAAGPRVSWVAAQAPEIQHLSELFEGKWETTERFEADESHQNGAAGSGVFSIHQGPGGNSLIFEYTSHSSMGPYSSSRIIYWDAGKDSYRAFYCDSMQPNGCGESGTGRWEGKDLVFESTMNGPAGPVQLVQTFSNMSGAGFTFSLDLINQGKTQRTLTIVARKRGARL